MAKWLDKYEQGGLVLKKKTKDNYGTKPNVNDAKVSAGPNFVGEGYTAYNWKSPAWGGQFEMGGSMPGSVGFMYARTQNPAPANGKYTKKTLASAQDGTKVVTGSEPKNKKIYGAPEEDKINDWFRQYYGSDFFKENIANGSGKAVKIDANQLSKDVINSINNTQVVYSKTPEQLTYSFPGKIIMGNPNEYGNQPRNETYAHEHGHTDEINILASQPGNMLYMLNQSGRKKDSDQLIKDLMEPIGQSKFKHAKSDVEKRKWLLEDFAQNEEYIAGTNHGKALTEQRADIMALRYLAAKKGIWDATKSKPGTFTSDMLNKLYKTKELNTPVTKNSTMGMGKQTYQFPEDLKQGDLKNVAPPKSPGTILPELRRKYKDSEILFLMNRLANNEDNAPIDQAQNGKEMQYYQDGLDFKPKSISKNGKVIKDDRGQWAHPGEVTEIGSPDITMQGVDYPVLGISNTGDTQMMYPDQDYKFDGNKVTEYPMAQDGKWLDKYKNEPKIQDATRNKQFEQSVKSQLDQYYRSIDPENQPHISQWNPKPGEREAQNAREAERLADYDSWVSRFSRNPHVIKGTKNLWDAGMFALDVMGAAEGLGALKDITLQGLKKASRFNMRKAASTVAEDRMTKATRDNVASTILNKNTGLTQLLDKEGKEIGTIKTMSPKEVQKFNQGLKKEVKQGATPPPPKGLEPYQTWDSEIDWGKWNPEIPKNEKLMDEYTRIEAATKSEGTWMKNPDGSKFAGTPEQFVQSRSENFKKAFPQGADITYRGDNEHYLELRPKADRWHGQSIFTANEGLARFYTAKGKQAGFFTPNEPTALERLQEYVSNNYPDMNVQDFMEKYPNLARGAMATEEAGIHQLAIPKTKNALDIDAKGWTWHTMENPEMNQKIIDAGIEKSVPSSLDNQFSTDDVAQYIQQKNIDRALIRNIDDGILGRVLIHNQKPGQYAKSLRGNNGMFDMNNPNVYAGFPNPLAIVDELTPKLDPIKLLGVQGDIMELSPLNLIPGYGKKLAGKNQAFRKFGNSIDDVIERQALSPKGGSPFRMGRDQIVREGNWAAMGEPAEGYGGVFEATFDLNNPAANLSVSRSANRNGVLIMDKEGRLLPDIPLTEPGMSFNRRLPFSTRYVPIDKQKLINNQFQFATMAPRLQSLVEKYGLGLGAASLIGKGAVDTYNKYTIDPVIDMAKKLELEKLGLNFKAPKDTSSKKESGGWLNKYK